MPGSCRRTREPCISDLCQKVRGPHALAAAPARERGARREPRHKPAGQLGASAPVFINPNGCRVCQTGLQGWDRKMA